MKSVHNLDFKYSTTCINRKLLEKRYGKSYRHHEVDNPVRKTCIYFNIWPLKTLFMKEEYDSTY